MNFAKPAIALALASTARAFSPAATRAFAPSARGVSGASGVVRSPMSVGRTFSATALGANVLKLTEPSKDLLQGVDVFIFDCDGVIWRVSGNGKHFPFSPESEMVQMHTTHLGAPA